MKAQSTLDSSMQKQIDSILLASGRQYETSNITDGICYHFSCHFTHLKNWGITIQFFSLRGAVLLDSTDTNLIINI